MSMNLSAEDLVTIHDAIESMNASHAPVSITQFRCAGHTVIVDRKDSKSDNSPYVVKGITTWVMRDSSGVNR